MVTSSEIRWFFQSKDPVIAIETWFNQNGQFFSGNWQRADIYLGLPDLQSHSVKIREGKVEVKVLQEDRGEAVLARGNSGLMNDWIKYSFTLSESDEENKTIIKGFNGVNSSEKEVTWIKVDKERLLIKYSLDYTLNKITKVPDSSWPDEGCGVELTKIAVNGQEYFTFGFEAFGKSRRENLNLDKVSNYVLHEIGTQTLKKTDSYSYPGFLASLQIG